MYILLLRNFRSEMRKPARQSSWAQAQKLNPSSSSLPSCDPIAASGNITTQHSEAEQQA